MDFLSPNDPIIGRFDSLDALLEAFAERLIPAIALGGYVGVHPSLLPEKGLTDYFVARRRVEAVGLRLVITPAVSRHSVELRRSASYPAVTADSAVRPLGDQPIST